LTLHSRRRQRALRLGGILRGRLLFREQISAVHGVERDGGTSRVAQQRPLAIRVRLILIIGINGSSLGHVRIRE